MTQLKLFEQEYDYKKSARWLKGESQFWELYDPWNEAWIYHYNDEYNPRRLCPVYIFSKLKIKGEIQRQPIYSILKIKK